MKKYMPLEGLRWSRDSGSTLCDTPQNGRSRTGWGGKVAYGSIGNEHMAQWATSIWLNGQRAYGSFKSYPCIASGHHNLTLCEHL